jgi:MOSC domain-containing protein YiiM
MSAIVTSINRSSGGVPKPPVAEACLSRAGLDGDRQRDLEHHGGFDRALCLFSADVIARLRDEGHPIAPGTTGENVTISGLDWSLVVPGVRLVIGDTEVQVTAYAFPCRNIRESFAGERFARLSAKLHPGESRVYARVLREGVIHTGDPVHLVGAARRTTA